MGCSSTTRGNEKGCYPIVQPCNPIVLLQLSTRNKASQCYCDDDGCNRQNSLIKTIFGGYLVVFVGSFGIIGNILTFVVLYSLKKKNDVEIILTGIKLAFYLLQYGFYHHSHSFSVLAVFDTLVVLTVILLKGWPNVTESSYHLMIFPIVHPLMMGSLMMSIYLIVLLTLERFYAVCLKGRAKKQGNQERIKLMMVVIFALVVIFIFPKCMEYTWQSSDVRTDYDLQDRKWTNILNNMSDFEKRKYNLDNGDHLAFLQNYRSIAESGAIDSKLTKYLHEGLV